MAFFFQIIDTSKDRFLGSKLRTPIETSFNNTPEISRPPSPLGGDDEPHLEREIPPSISSTRSRRRRLAVPLPRLQNLHIRTLRNSLALDEEEPHVGLFETQRYLNLEARMFHPNSEQLTEQATSLLYQSTKGILLASATGLELAIEWLDRLNTLRFRYPWQKEEGTSHEESLAACQKAASDLEEALTLFRSRKGLPSRVFHDSFH